MKLSHLLANDIRAEREIEAISRRRRDDPNRTAAPGTSSTLWPTTVLHRLLPAR